MKIINEKGITLIALIITIILMLILAGVVISLTIGENGLIDKTKYAVEETKKAEIKEEIEIAILDMQSELQAQKEPKDLTNTDVIEKLPNKINNITIHENMTGEYKGYEYWIDEEYKVHVGEKTTNPIKIKVTPTYVGTSSCTIEVEATSTKGNIVNYQYKINNEIKQETNKNTATIEELEPVTKYVVTVIATDEKGNTKTSMPITITTQKRTYIMENGKTQLQPQTFNAKITPESGYYKVEVNATNRDGCWFYYDITNYKTVKLDVEVVYKDANVYCGVGGALYSGKLNPMSDVGILDSCDIAMNYEAAKPRQIYKLNIGENEGESTITINKNSTSPARSATIKIYNIWLEK